MSIDTDVLPTSSAALQGLAPHGLWWWFGKICSIAHPSHHEQQLSAYIIQWAKNKKLSAQTDTIGNILITKPATKGYESHAPVALQAHLDMVAQANGDFDFIHSPITPIVEGQWVRADGTTLGADNGIGMASILAILDSDTLAHPKIEALLTITEEIGMVGAINLQPNWLTATRMINTDTEQINEIYVGCAGGADADIDMSPTYTSIADMCFLRYTIAGLKGGHSGIDIHKNNANAILLLAHILSDIDDIHLITLTGGTARNAIPRSAEAVFAIPSAQKDTALQKINQASSALQDHIGAYETQMHWSIQETSAFDTALNAKDSKRVLDFLHSIPNGVLRYSDAVADTVETSLSLGMVSVTQDRLHATSLIRSLNALGTDFAKALVQSACRLGNMDVTFSGEYTGWTPNMQSPITQTTYAVYQQQINQEPAIKVIHAGLECGLIKQVYPDMDIVSIGPTIQNAHSPDERVHIPSVQTYWNVLTAVLAALPTA